MNNTKYFLYARKSTEDEERQVMSIEAQIVELLEYAKRENIEIIEKFIESKSAKKPGREIFNNMIEKIYQSKEPIGIISWHPDRLARNSVDGGQIIYLIDQGKISSLRFPCFWFEPTPQGLFMLQVAFGQSKYYSDNLSENVKRGIRQKLRKGEWPTLAPFGYVNNPKTRNIEPDPIKSKVIQLAFKEFAEGKHTLGSLGLRFKEFGIESTNRTPLARATIQRMLSNIAYIGLIKHNNEIYEAKYEPIISRQLFEDVQKKLKERSRPRKSKSRHDFPFLGLLRCSNCKGMITAQWAKGKYRYYRCSKKHGKCYQPYISETKLAEQLKSHLQTVAISDDWKNKMLIQVDKWEKENNQSSQSFAQELENELNSNNQKLVKLVSTYLDGDIDKSIYLTKKEELMKQKISLTSQKSQKKKNWVEPMREWIKTSNEADSLSKSDDFHKIKEIFQKIGTNRFLSNGEVLIDFSDPWLITAQFRHELRADTPTAPQARLDSSTENLTCFRLSGCRESNADRTTPSRA